ncbi:MAG: NAD-dependent protein deacylase, partial [Clostridia bacterium]
MTAEMEALREKIAQANQIVFLGGAGVSTESGIPDFRSAHGLYHAAEGRSYEEMLSIGYFIGRTDAFWDFFRNVMLYPKAQPNPAHFALARLERQGKLQSVLTQNIDGLHQLAGSQRVLELHGTVYRNSCLKCHRVYSLGDVLAQRGTPHCTACGGTLRPDIVMYGEPLDQQVLAQAVSAVTHCDLLIVGGTSLVVHPAASLVTYRRHGTELVLIN